MTKTLINICGSQRSGSTMLDLILGNDPRAFSCGEVYALYHPWRKHHFQPTCGCGSKCEYLQEFKKVRPEEFHRTLFEKFGFSWVIDSSKDLNWVIDNQRWIINQKGRVLNLVIWKQPASFCISFLKRGEDRDYWRDQFINYYQRFLETQLPFVSVCYDDFVNQPEGYLQRLCELVCMDYFPSKMNFWEKTHHQLFGSGGTARQVKDGASEIFLQDENSDRFAAQIEEVEKQLGEDRAVNAVISALRANRLSLSGPNGSDLFNTGDSGRKRLWYFQHKLHLRFKRYVPDAID